MLKLRFKNNKHNAVWLVEPKVTLGAAADNSLTLTGRGIASHHAEIAVDSEQLTLRNLANGKNVWHNGQLVAESAAIVAGDQLRVGTVELEVIDPKHTRKEVPTVARNEESTGWALKANHSALSNRVFPIKPISIVGRSSDCDITIAAAHLSRRHAELIVKDGQLYVRDLQSSNGTYLNGKRIEEGRVKRGDELRFDTLCFGVIGPANDLDKTSVRTVKRPVQTQPKSVPAAAKGRPAQPRSMPKPRPQVVQHSSNEADVHSGNRAGLVVTVAVVLGVVAFAAIYLGLVPSP